MKKSILLLSVAVMTFASCKKATCEDGEQNQNEIGVDCGGACGPCPIEYPETGTYGTNILATAEDTVYFNHQHYSLRAVIPEGSTLKLKLNSVIGGSWWYSVGSNVGWSISDYTSGVQHFEGLNSTCELDVDLANMSGMFEVWYYENSTSVTRVRYVYVN